MAVALYYAWDRLGRPLEPCQPIRDVVNRLKVAYPQAATEHLFSWYANEAHYQAEPPQDHTPFSSTGWPKVSPQWVVFATDVMHRPDLGVDCFVLFNYWIKEARAGRMPWLKYLIWRGKSYDVRSGWIGKDAAGHFDHIHMSARTDHQYTTLGAWKLVPVQEEVEDMTPDEHRMLANLDRTNTAVLFDTDNITQVNGTETYPFMIARRLKALETQVGQILALVQAGGTPPGTPAPTVEQIADELAQRLAE